MIQTLEESNFGKEVLWLTYINDGQILYYITSNKIRSIYYLYEVKNSKPIKTKYKSANPTDLYKYMKG